MPSWPSEESQLKVSAPSVSVLPAMGVPSLQAEEGEAQSIIHPSGVGGSGASAYLNCHESSLSSAGAKRASTLWVFPANLSRVSLEEALRDRLGAEISPQPVHSASSVRHCRLHRSTGRDTQLQDAHDTAQ